MHIIFTLLHVPHIVPQECRRVHTLEAERGVKSLGTGIVKIHYQPHTLMPCGKSPLGSGIEQHAPYPATAILWQHSKRVKIELPC